MEGRCKASRRFVSLPRVSRPFADVCGQVRIDAPGALEQSVHGKRLRVPQSDEEDEEIEIEPLPQKTKRRKKPKTAHPKDDVEDTEMIRIEDGDVDSTSIDRPQAHQLKFYKGEQKQLIDLALFFFRLYLFNVNAYPDAEELITWARNAYVAGCKSYYGSKYKSA